MREEEEDEEEGTRLGFVLASSGGFCSHGGDGSQAQLQSKSLLCEIRNLLCATSSAVEKSGHREGKYTVLQTLLPPPSPPFFPPLLQWSFAATVVSDCSDCPRARCADVAFALNTVHASLSFHSKQSVLGVMGILQETPSVAAAVAGRSCICVCFPPRGLSACQRTVVKYLYGCCANEPSAAQKPSSLCCWVSSF